MLEELLISNQITTGNVKTLTALPDEIGNITSLKKLEVVSNKLTSLPTTIGGLTSLEELYLGNGSGQGNELTGLPSEIGNLSSLKILDVRQNRLSTLPTEIGNLSNLETLNISYQITYNPETYYLTNLPATINNLTKLKSFHAEGNRIEGDLDLSNITTLTDLQFFNNRISGLKLGIAPFYSALTSNPNLSCIEVPTAEVTNWENANSGIVQIDNGVAFSDNCTGYRVPQLEREALISFYNSTGGGTDWTGQFWDTDPTSLSNVGAWSGVTTALVNGQKHVVEINLNNIHFNGFVPSEIKDLTELVKLDLGFYQGGQSNLTELKPEIGELSKLIRLDLYGHKLTSLPTEIGNLTSLTYLNISNNQLASLPAGIGNFTKLEELHLEHQESYDTTTGIREKTLTGLPNEIGSIASLKKLYLQHNALTSLPTTIGNLSSLEILQVEQNALLSLPTSINNLTMLDELVANNNFIEGDLDFSNLKVLNRLYLQYNNISGIKLNLAPTAFNDNQYYLNLTRNAIGCIEVPSDELVSWQLSNYTEENNYIDNGVVYSDNCNGVTNNSVPDLEREALIAIYNSTNGSSWNNDLSSNSYQGVFWVADINQKRNVGAWFGVTTAIINGQKHVTKVELNSNLLEGTIPSEIKNLTQLKELELSSNAISELPSEIGELTYLEQLTLSGQYNSTNTEYVLKNIPSEINNIISLKRLDIDGNQIEGNLNLSNLVNLDALSVSSNQITGLKIGISPNVFDGSYDSEGQYSRTFSFYNQYLNCVAVPQNTIADWEATSFAASYPNIVWGQDCTVYNNVPDAEKQALIDMYTNLDGANWANNTNWSGNTGRVMNATTNVTTWYGVTTKIVDGGKHITSLHLNNNKLDGTISSSIGNINKIEELILSSNKLSGILPKEISNLSNLKTAYFQDNQLSGKLPDLSGITKLETLYISTNKFQFGGFEDEFPSYQNLTNPWNSGAYYSPQSKSGTEESIEIGFTGVTLEAEVSGNHNEYQWYKNGGIIPDATSKSYVISEATVNDAGYYFCSVSNTVVTSLIIQTENKTIIFKATMFTLSLDATNGSVTSNPDPINGTYDEGTSVTLTVVPDAGFEFDGWSGDASGNENPLTITIDSDKTIAAIFTTTLSTEDDVFSKTFKIYPNPVNDVLIISNTNDIIIDKVEIFTLLGQKVDVIEKPQNTIDISQLSKGIYLLNIFTERGKATKRIIKK